MSVFAGWRTSNYEFLNSNYLKLCIQKHWAHFRAMFGKVFGYFSLLIQATTFVHFYISLFLSLCLSKFSPPVCNFLFLCLCVPVCAVASNNLYQGMLSNCLLMRMHSKNLITSQKSTIHISISQSKNLHHVYLQTCNWVVERNTLVRAIFHCHCRIAKRTWRNGSVFSISKTADILL